MQDEAHEQGHMNLMQRQKTVASTVTEDCNQHLCTMVLTKIRHCELWRADTVSLPFEACVTSIRYKNTATCAVMFLHFLSSCS